MKLLRNALLIIALLALTGYAATYTNRFVA